MPDEQMHGCGMSWVSRMLDAVKQMTPEQYEEFIEAWKEENERLRKENERLRLRDANA